VDADCGQSNSRKPLILFRDNVVPQVAACLHRASAATIALLTSAKGAFFSMRFVTLFSLFAAVSWIAHADSIAVHSTGNGSTTDGTLDPNWTYTNSSNTTANALVANKPGTDFWNGGTCFSVPCGPWAADTTSSSWLVDNTANPQTGGLPLSFQTTFNLAGLDPSTASVSLEWGVDDTGTLLLNGNVVASLSDETGGAPWTSLHVVTLNSGFLPGVNTLEVALTSSDDNFEGARVQINSATASPAAVPEPSSFVLLAGVVSALVCFRRRKPSSWEAV
jgi:hypothetical protein